MDLFFPFFIVSFFLLFENRFAGWMDCPLTDLGVEEAREAARRLRASGLDDFDVVYTSVLKRSIKVTYCKIIGSVKYNFASVKKY